MFCVFFKLLGYSLAIFLIFSTVLLVGVDVERRVWHEAPSTIHHYTNNEVCAVPLSANDGQRPQTMKIDSLSQQDYKVVNCGNCGHCSNPNDIAIYHHSRETLTETMTECARVGFFSRKTPQVTWECFKEQARLTDSCTDCWIDNALCTFQKCIATCFKWRFLPFLPSLSRIDADPRLNPCHACDEKLCGPAFLECSGANRRRVGVVTDIQRDEGTEVCDLVDMEWILSQAATPEQQRAVGKENYEDGREL